MFGSLPNRGRSEHEWVEERLSAYIDGELSAKETARVEKHLQECQACTENLATLRQTVSLLRELPTVPAPRSFAVRPAPVRPKARVAARGWGYGLLKAATALAALLLVLLIGGDLGLQFIGGFRLAAPAPMAPAAEVALAPSALPTITTMEADEEFMGAERKVTETPTVGAAPWNAEEPPSLEVAPTVTETSEAYYPAPSVQDTASPVSERAEGAEATGTPAASATPVGTALPEEQEIGAGAVEATAIPVPTATPEVVAMAEIPADEIEARGEGHLEAEISPLLPLRWAELMVFFLLLLLISATLFTRRLVRR